MTMLVIKNLRWDHQDVPHEASALSILLPEHMIAVFHVPGSKLALRETDHIWFVPVVGQCTILDRQDCQFALFGIADD